MSEAGLRDRAGDLLYEIRNDRQDDESATLRPIIFVGHGLGGILIMRVSASCFSPARTSSTYVKLEYANYAALTRRSRRLMIKGNIVLYGRRVEA